jgi:hypothetical protein
LSFVGGVIPDGGLSTLEKTIGRLREQASNFFPSLTPAETFG